jgi:chromosome transmission fidelity protein 4
MFPDPVRNAISTNGSATIPTKLSTGLDLFGEDSQKFGKGGNDDAADVDLDDDMLDVDDGWIVDDMDGALHAEPKVGRHDGFVKEMGEFCSLARML